MENKEKDENKSSRRGFLKLGAGLGAAAVASTLGSSLFSLSATANSETGEKVKVLTTDGQLIEIDKAYIEKSKDTFISREEAHKGIPARKFVMVIDLAKCKNARKCVEVCQEGHHLPNDHEWMRLYLLQESPNTAPYWFPRPCFHCDNPMCVSVCPVGATYKRSDGIVLIDNERCIGCKFCMTGCPYSVRVFHWKAPTEEAMKEQYSPETGFPAQEGTVGKCVFCPDLLRKGELPRCAQACPMGVIYFGDLVEDTVTNGTETVKFSDLVRDRGGFRYLESLGTEPSVYYLPPSTRQFPYERGLEGLDDSIKDRYKDAIRRNSYVIDIDESQIIK
jgi:molybdopterin-containing oxidoreductase family iron-sulfur binding subunit